MSEIRQSDRDMLDDMVERAGTRPPEYVDDVLRATRGVRQRPAWTFGPASLRGGSTGNVLRIAVVAALLALVPALLMLGGGTRPQPVVPPATPVPSAQPPAPTASPASSTVGAGTRYEACSASAGAPAVLTVWDIESDADVLAALDALDARFETANPGIDIVRVHQAGVLPGDLLQAIAGPSAPDIAQVEGDAASLGALAAAGHLVALEDGAAEYAWADRWPASLLDRGRADLAGRVGEGTLYGVASTGRIIGLYFNVDLAGERPAAPYPVVLADELDDLAAMAAAGHVPLVVGAADGGLVDLYAVLVAAASEPGWARDLALRRDGATFDTEGTRTAAEMLLAIADRGYLVPGYAGLTRQAAADRFAAGTGELLVGDTSLSRALNAGGTELGVPMFTVFPPARPDAADHAAGGVGALWVVPAAGRAPACATAYVDWVTGDAAAGELAMRGILPSHATYAVPEFGADTFQDLAALFRSTSAAGTLEVPVDEVFPGARTVLEDGLARLVAGEINPETLAAELDAAYRAAP